MFEAKNKNLPITIAHSILISIILREQYLFGTAYYFNTVASPYMCMHSYFWKFRIEHVQSLCVYIIASNNHVKYFIALICGIWPLYL